VLGRINFVHVIYLPTHLTALPPRAFSECPWLRHVNTGQCQQLRTIGRSCFYGCMYLTSLELPDSLEKWEHRAFAGSGVTELLCGHLRTCRIRGVEGATWLSRLVLPGGGPAVRLRTLPRLRSVTAPQWEGEVVTDCVLRATSFRSSSVWIGGSLLLGEVAHGGRQTLPAAPP
jgi:hypothetical protein